MVSSTELAAEADGHHTLAYGLGELPSAPLAQVRHHERLWLTTRGVDYPASLVIGPRNQI